jgi:hypothetical protein
MWKKKHTCVVTHKERYEKQAKYFLCFDHIEHGAKLYKKSQIKHVFLLSETIPFPRYPHFAFQYPKLPVG